MAVDSSQQTKGMKDEGREKRKVDGQHLLLVRQQIAIERAGRSV